MADPRDYKLDICGLTAPADEQNTLEQDMQSAPRPFLRVQFACCNVYQRIYRSPDGKAYHGRCPRCGNPVKFVVGEGGTSTRDFIVY